MAGISLRSMKDAVSVANSAGLTTEIVIILDKADEGTKAVFADFRTEGWRLEEVSFGDQGRVRNYAISISTGDYIAFLDGDDLWSENWLTAAYKTCNMDAGRIIAHPEMNWFFQNNNNLFFHIDQDDERFNPAFLRVMNYWDALCMAPRVAHEQHPYAYRDIQGGFAYEDWQWNCETLEAGFRHKVAMETIHFKRRRNGSQTLQASGRRTLTRTTELHHYDWYASFG